jgi:hydroxyquinol 1,2-dioxygenase
MIIRTQKDVTPAVLAEIARAENPRFREIMSALVRHLHAFAREVKLTETEYQAAAATIAALGQRTTASHNEAILMGGALGLSTLVCLLNNGDNGAAETTANLLGPFWRENSPPTENGASIVRSATPGEPIFVTARIRDQAGSPVAGAEVDVWHSSTQGYYENQDPAQADMNLRGKFTSGADGRISFRSIKPAGYPIPVDGPVGDLLRAQKRANMRPAHLHFLIYKPGFKTHISQVYTDDDPNLATDSQFGVTAALIGHYVRHDNEPLPSVPTSADGGRRVRAGDGAKTPWYSLEFTFRLEPGIAEWPRPPIRGKARGERPAIERLKRT